MNTAGDEATKDKGDKPNKPEEMVMTPGGPKPKSHVHPVDPDEMVRRNEDGTLSVVPREPPPHPEAQPNMTDELVVAPGGYRPKSKVHHVPPGHSVDGSQGRIKIIHPSGSVVADLGPLVRRLTNQPLMPENVSQAPRVFAAFGSGWIVNTQWSNSTGSPVSSFSSTWTVPPPPETQSNQIIFLFNGVQNSTMIYQPVLQWGVSEAGGGNYWAVASWYADGQQGHSFYSQLVPVNPGDILVGVMTLTGTSAQGFSYNCGFQGIPATSLPITNVEELTWCIETLEAYGITQCSDYPNTDKTAFTQISLQDQSGSVPLVWGVQDRVSDCGQHANVVDNSSTNGEVDLFYH
jgi:hypothetical protein